MSRKSDNKSNLILLLQQRSGEQLPKEEAEVIVDRLLHLYRVLIRKPSSDFDDLSHTSS